jgi:hypothetical protein
MTEAEVRRRLHYDHTGRTPQDYAIEHAGYLATAVQHFLSRLDAEFDANEALEAAEAADAEDAAEKADDLNSIQREVSDARRALQSAVYEFEKRRDRALGALGVKVSGETQRGQEVADVLTRLTATMTRNGESHKHPELMLEADRALVRFSAGTPPANGVPSHE